MGMPTCEYSVHSGSVDGPLLSYASVGDIVCKHLAIVLSLHFTTTFRSFTFGNAKVRIWEF